MRLPGKLGSLLGKNQNDASFTLDDFLLPKEAPNADPSESEHIQQALASAETAIKSASAPLQKSAPMPEAVESEPPSKSILDLEFLDESLDELTADNEAEGPLDSIEALLPFTLNTQDNSSSAISETESSGPKNFPAFSRDTALERALSESLLLDTDYSYAIFDQGGEIVTLSDSLVELVDMPESTRGEVTCYRDLLEIMAEKSHFGNKDVDALLHKEAVNMPLLAGKKEFRVFKWDTVLTSGKTLEFKNKYTPSGYLVTVVSDVTTYREHDRILRMGLELGMSGYWSYHLSSKKSVWGGYLVDLMKNKQLHFSDTDDISALVHPDDSKRVMSAFSRAVKTGKRLELKFRVNSPQDKDETHLRLIGQADRSPITQEAETFIAYISDITEEKRQAKELAETKELSQNRSHFLSRMSHEIKTPLNAIIGMTEALREDVDNEDTRETAQFISDAAENLNKILSQTLEHERLATTELTLEEHAVNLENVTRSVMGMWKKPCADKGVDLKLRVSPDLPKYAILDQSRLRQCLTNLLSNAVKFTSTGSILLVIGLTKSGSGSDQLIFGVKDSGIGMSKAAAEKIFKPFQQADPSIHSRFGGSGLGMSITNQIVEAMQGQIKVKSAEGEGTTVVITLPLKTDTHVAAAVQGLLSDKDAQSNEGHKEARRKLDHQDTLQRPKTGGDNRLVPSPKPEPRSETGITPALETFHDPALAVTANNGACIVKNKEIVPSDYSGFNLLIVEDNPINQAVVRKLLVNHIRSMTFAFHGQEALKLLEKKVFDVILMDIHMPVKDGIETTLEIRNSGKPWADTTIIALTADPDFQQKRVCRNIGMDDALSKPVRRQELLDAMQKVLDNRRSKAQVA